MLTLNIKQLHYSMITVEKKLYIYNVKAESELQ